MIDIDDLDLDLITPPAYDWNDFDPVAFETWLRTPGILLNDWEVPFWQRAVQHRHAWTCGRMLEYQSPQDMVNSLRDIMSGCCAWVSPEGDVFPVAYAAHDAVAEVIIGKKVTEIETTHARISTLGRSFENFFGYVERPTPKQRRAVTDFVSNNLHHFGQLKDF